MEAHIPETILPKLACGDMLGQVLNDRASGIQHFAAVAGHSWLYLLGVYEDMIGRL